MTATTWSIGAAGFGLLLARIPQGYSIVMFIGPRKPLSLRVGPRNPLRVVTRCLGYEAQLIEGNRNSGRW